MPPPGVAPGAVAAAAEKTAKPIIGGIFLLLVFFKCTLLLVAALGVMSVGFGGLASTDIGMAYLATQALGMVGALVAMILCFMRKMWMIALVCSLLALVGGAAFGLMIFIGPLGLIFGIIGLLMVLLSKKEFSG
jgi:hypothetical protein